MNIILDQTTNYVTIRLLGLEPGNPSQSDETIDIEKNFYKFASRHRWMAHGECAVTPDIAKTNFFNIPRALSQKHQLFVSFEELHLWWKSLNPRTKNDISNLLDDLQCVFKYSSFCAPLPDYR